MCSPCQELSVKKSHVHYDLPSHSQAFSSSMSSLFYDIQRFNEGQRCWHCGRPAALYGFRNPETWAVGWCFMCQRHYKQNDVDWILRLSKWPLQIIGDVRQRIVLLLAGSLASLETKYVQRKIWRRILGSGNRAFYVPESDSESTEPSSDSDGDYDFIQHDSGCMFDARGLRLFINPFHKLRGTSLHLVLDFLGNFQLKTCKR